MLNSVQKAAYELIQADARFLYTLTVIQRNAKNISSNYIMMSQPYIGLFTDGAEQWCQKLGLGVPQFTDIEKTYYTALRQSHKLYEMSYSDYLSALMEKFKASDNYFYKISSLREKLLGYYNVGTDLCNGHFCGNGLRAVLKFNVFSNSTGLIILLAVNIIQNGAIFQFTPFSIGVSLFAAINNLLFVFCSIKSFNIINLSLYSLFAMLGGMALPFVAGTIFWKEEVTVGKVICFVIIVIALCLTVKKDNKKSGTIYYIGVFIFNGMSGVISKFYSESKFEKAENAGYSAQIALFVIAICVVVLLLNKQEKQKTTKKALMYSFCYGIMSNVRNFLLLLGLIGLPASAQYPFVTGGTMIVSTLLCYFTPNKPSKREMIAVVLSFVGVLALMPIGILTKELF